jgi:predicted membrane protein
MKRAFLKFLKWALLFDLVALVIAQIAKQLIPEIGDENSDVFQVVTMTGGRNWVSKAEALRSGTVITGMGGMEMDLTHAELDSAGAHLKLVTVMGGAEIRVPRDWNVELKGWAFMGGHANAARKHEVPEDAPHLIIEGSTVMGGVAVTSAKETSRL